jgi:hypothetical protein
MDVQPEDKALRSHPVPAELLLHAMKAIIEGKKEGPFLQAFAKSFVLASEHDIAEMKRFIEQHGDPASMSAKAVVGAQRC